MSLDFFFFKQKTAYEMRISDWSSDVCSSDLHLPAHPGAPIGDDTGEDDIDSHRQKREGDQPPAELHQTDHADGDKLDHRRPDVEQQEIEHGVDALGDALYDLGQIGSASCRERVLQNV